ncbi:aminoimidazole riboside kinase [Escherichia coli]|uniref:Aminoimidazole riboside kinase n=1 Tax=Escherichia coli TaxID=562 RepID=A0A2X3K2S4_ECOLX|nr:aminoimidazole riboside kinase [Escherichia coli]
MPEVLSASILIFVKIYGKTSICSACVCGRRLQLADVVKLSEEEWRLISGKTQNDRDICALAKEYEIAMLLVTKGAEGVVVCYRGQVHHFAGMSVNCVDSTGAGDAFVAGLLTGLSSTGLSTDEREMRRIIDLAQRCGALAVTAKGQ